MWGYIPCSVDMHCIHRSSWNSVICFYYCYYFADYIKWVNLWITLHWSYWIIKFSKKACVHFPCLSSGSSSMSSIPPLSPSNAGFSRRTEAWLKPSQLMTFIFPHGIHKIRYIFWWSWISTDSRKDHLGIQPDKIGFCLSDLARENKGPWKFWSSFPVPKSYLQESWGGTFLSMSIVIRQRVSNRRSV